MTLSPWIIYIWGIADNFKSVASTVSGITFIVAAFALAFGLCEDKKPAIAIGWVALAISVCTTTAGVLTPSSRTIAVMVVAPAIVNSEPIQKDLPELYKAAKEALMNTLTQK